MLKSLVRLVVQPLAALAVRLNKHYSPSPDAIVGRATRFHPESQVDNGSKDRTRIVVGSSTHIRGRLVVFPNGGRITVGNDCYVGHRSEIWSMSQVIIGNRVLIAHDVMITDSTAHSSNAAERHNHFRTIINHGFPSESSQLPGVTTSPVVLEDDVWLNFGVIILKGVRIGRGSIIGAGTTITHDIPPNVIVYAQSDLVIRPLDNMR